jgi:hypothetical protein
MGQTDASFTYPRLATVSYSLHPGHETTGWILGTGDLAALVALFVTGGRPPSNGTG